MSEANSKNAPLPADRLSVRFGGLTLKNPIFGASGTFGYGESFDRFYRLEKIGGFFTKGLSIEPKIGNRAPRIVEAPSGIINSIGLENIGMDRFAREVAPRLKARSALYFINFFGESIDGYRAAAERAERIDGAAGLEINISCPNVKKGGIAFGVDPDLARAVIGAVRRVTRKTLIVKLAPNVADIALFAKIAEDEGADGLALINTFPAIAIDIHARRPTLGAITGGLSGPAIRPLALRAVWECHKKVKIPIFGVGGISRAEEAIEFMMAGARAVQIGSRNFVDPTIGARIVDQLPSLLDRLGFDSIEETIGAASEK